MPDVFENYNWHDNAIHGIRVVEGTDCGGELILDIDFIVEWLPPESNNNAFRFKIAPANLTFHDVTDLIISVDYTASSAAFQPMIIHEIHREIVTYPNGYSSFAWNIEINWPRNSFISFCSNGFSQVMRKQPFISGAQYLSPTERISCP